MLKFLYKKVKGFFTPPQQTQVVISNGERELPMTCNSSPEINVPEANRPENINGLRNQIIRDELISETAGIESSTLRIVESANDITYEQQVQSLTSNGLEINTKEVLIRTAEGHLVKVAELHHGGECDICQRLSDGKHFCLCAECRIPLCRKCAKRFGELTLCPEHYRQAVFHRDAWEDE